MARVDDYARRNQWLSVQEGVRGGDHKGKDSGRSALIVNLLEALVEDRVRVVPRAGPNAFPASGEQDPGSSPDFPALISLSPEPRKGWFVEEVQGVGIYNAVEPEDDGDLSYTLNPPKE